MTSSSSSAELLLNRHIGTPSRTKGPSVASFFGPGIRQFYPDTSQVLSPRSSGSSGSTGGSSSSYGYLDSDHLPHHLRQLIEDFVRERGSDVKLPCLTAYRAESLNSMRGNRTGGHGKRCRWWHTATAKPVVAKQYIWKKKPQATRLIVVQGGGLPEASLVSWQNCSGAPRDGSCWFIWRGLAGYETYPSILKLPEGCLINDALADMARMKPSHRSRSDFLDTGSVLGKRSARPDSREDMQEDEEANTKQRRVCLDTRRDPIMVGPSSDGLRDGSVDLGSVLLCNNKRASPTSVSPRRQETNNMSAFSSATSEARPRATYTTSLDLQEVAERTKFLFHNQETGLTRRRSLADIPDIEDLWGHAICAGIATYRTKLLLVQIQESGEKRMVFNKDSADWADLMSAIRTIFSWRRSESLECEVIVQEYV